MTPLYALGVALDGAETTVGASLAADALTAMLREVREEFRAHAGTLLTIALHDAVVARQECVDGVWRWARAT